MINNCYDLVDIPNVNINLFGSRVYGTSTEHSDFDYQVIVPDDCFLAKNFVTTDIHVRTFSEYKRDLDEHEVSAVETYFTPDFAVRIRGKIPEFVLDKTKLRNSFAKVASNSWVKSKKKLLDGEDFNPYVAYKSTFHSLRILDFACQIAKTGKIYNFSSMNHVMLWMRQNHPEWQEINDKWKPEYNRLSSELRVLCPKQK